VWPQRPVHRQQQQAIFLVIFTANYLEYMKLGSSKVLSPSGSQIGSQPQPSSPFPQVSGKHLNLRSRFHQTQQPVAE
jgi:hypothetical protein